MMEEHRKREMTNEMLAKRQRWIHRRIKKLQRKYFKWKLHLASFEQLEKQKNRDIENIRYIFYKMIILEEDVDQLCQRRFRNPPKSILTMIEEPKDLLKRKSDAGTINEFLHEWLALIERKTALMERG